MNNLNKIFSSIILYSIISYTFGLPHLLIGLVFSILASQFSIVLPGSYKTSLVMYIPLIALLLVYPSVSMALIIGYSASLLIDILSKRGCQLLYPYSNMVFTGPENYINNDTRSEASTTVFLLALATTALLFSFYGVEILDSISQEDLSAYINSNDYTGNNNGGSVQYINIDPSKDVNKNITTISTNNTTTTLISEYNP